MFNSWQKDHQANPMRQHSNIIQNLSGHEEIMYKENGYECGEPNVFGFSAMQFSLHLLEMQPTNLVWYWVKTLVKNIIQNLNSIIKGVCSLIPTKGMSENISCR